MKIQYRKYNNNQHTQVDIMLFDINLWKFQR